MLSDPIAFLNQGWLSLLLGVVSLVLSVALYYRGPRKGRLATEWIGTPHAGYQHDQDADVLPAALTIQYRGDPVPRVGLTDVLLWNGGGDTLRGEDVVAADAIRVEAPEGTRILDAVPIYVTRPAGGWAVRRDPERPEQVVHVTFGYAEPGDGIRFRVVHTGADLELALLGEVRGMRDGIAQLGQLGPNRLPYAGWRAAAAQARRERRPWHRATRLARLSVPVVVPVVLALVVTWALWRVMSTPAVPTPRGRTVAHWAVAFSLAMVLVTYALCAAILRRHLGFRQGVRGAPPALYGSGEDGELRRLPPPLPMLPDSKSRYISYTKDSNP